MPPGEEEEEEGSSSGKSVAPTEAMGNKSSAGGTRDGEVAAAAAAATGSVSGAGPPGPELLASLQTLRDAADSSSLPLSLHQMAESSLARDDYQWAIRFLQLEKLYHQRLLDNIAALQDDWESRWREKGGPPAEADESSWRHMETLSHICRTHLRPSVGVEQTPNTQLRDVQDPEETQELREPAGNKQSEDQQPSSGGGEEEEEEEEEETYEEGQEVEEETPEEEEVKVEWPTGVPQASDKDLAKLSVKEGSSSPDGLVSILKRRRASLDGLPPPCVNASKQNNKRKVRFSEPEDGAEPDEVSGDSCLVLLLLCLVTVVISVGGTALYCSLVGSASICTDFTHNVDFYIANARGFLAGLGRWLPLPT